MKYGDLTRPSKNVLTILCLGLLLSAPIPGFAVSASASVSVVNLSKMADLLSRMKVASAKVRKLEALTKHQNSVPKSEAKHELHSSIVARKKAGEVFQTTLYHLLVESPGSVKLLTIFANAFNTRVDAEDSLAGAESILRKDQETIQYLKKALNAVVTGGQSDMNSELGSMRLKLEQASIRITGDKADVTLAVGELALANTKLNEANSNAHEDRLASIAIEASTEIDAKATPLKRMQENPFAWTFS